MFQTNVMLPVLPIYADPAHHAGGASLLFRVRGEGRSPKGRSGRGVLGRSPGRKNVSRILEAQMASLGTCCGIKGEHGSLKSADGFATHRQLAN